MLKTIRDMLLGAIITAAISSAFAVIGTQPLQYGGPALIDQQWLYGLAGGLNQVYQNGISAAGSTQATATALSSGVALLEIDTVGSSTGVNLPPALQGTEVNIYNNGANTLTVYPAVANNPITAAQDTINNGTSTSVNTHVSLICFSAKNGVWACQ